MSDSLGKILVVDDMDMVRDMLSDTLIESGYTVDVAVDGEDAFTKFEADGNVSLVISDMEMPVLDGIGFIKKLRAAKHEVPILVLTGNKDVSSALDAIHAGADDYILKDENIQETIVLHTRKVFEKRRILDEMKSLNAQLNVRNQFILKTFGRYMSNEVVEKLLESPDGLKLGGEALVVTVLMSDLRGFSNITEKLPPEDVVSMLNVYFSEMTSIIFKHFGTISEMIGDGLLVLFGAPQTRPEDPDLALSCALEMQLAMEKVNAKNREMGFPAIEMGIGITTGRIVVGNVGSDKRVKYTAIGESVNMAGRIESYTVGGQVLVSEATLKATTLKAETKNKFSVSFKGLSKPADIYELFEVTGKFNVSLPETEIVYVHLEKEIPVVFDVFEEKVTAGETQKGAISSLALKHAILEHHHIGKRAADIQLVDIHSNLKIILPFNDDAGNAAEVYVKVIKKLEGSKFLVRFTSISDDVNNMLDNIRKG